MARNADKEQVKRKLAASINYCNSHHVPVQPLFEGCVDTAVDASVATDPEARKHDMKALFPILLDEKTAGFVPSIPMQPEMLELGEREFVELWLSKWIGKYLSAWRSLPSERFAQSKRAATDLALVRMVLPHAGSIDTAYEWAAHHNLYMSAENIGGNLLEQYIAGKIRPYGWIWCRGEILTAIDFCNDACTTMFQVKNKSNTENSSGKGFREDRGAVSWYRMRAEKRAGVIETYWPKLVDMVREGATVAEPVPDDLMTEEDYLAFVEDVSRTNPDLITAEEN